MQRCWGGPRLKLPIVTDKQVRQQDSLKLRRFRHRLAMMSNQEIRSSKKFLDGILDKLFGPEPESTKEDKRTKAARIGGTSR